MDQLKLLECLISIDLFHILTSKAQIGRYSSKKINSSQFNSVNRHYSLTYQLMKWLPEACIFDFIKGY